MDSFDKQNFYKLITLNKSLIYKWERGLVNLKKAYENSNEPTLFDCLIEQLNHLL